jgi:hypothetical protein
MNKTHPSTAEFKQTGNEIFPNVRKFGFKYLPINCLLDSTYQIIFKNVIELHRIICL